MDRFVVFSQSNDNDHRVGEVWGPFGSYDRAADFTKHMREQDGRLWYGIRVLQPTKIMRMS